MTSRSDHCFLHAEGLEHCRLCRTIHLVFNYDARKQLDARLKCRRDSECIYTDNHPGDCLRADQIGE
jgi:hypothetical protein